MADGHLDTLRGYNMHKIISIRPHYSLRGPSLYLSARPTHAASLPNVFFKSLHKGRHFVVCYRHSRPLLI